MSKFCIFCGEKPDKKTKEHVIPQWLIKLTDHEGRKTGYGIKNNKPVQFPWMQYTFPACKICNEKYSDLEGRLKYIIERLLVNEKLSQSDITDLLDWFDKVRIGIWLGQSLLHGEELSPNFYINQRVGISDRLVVIYRSIEGVKGIAFTGSESLAYKYSPSCLSLTINHLTFVSYSSAMLLSKNMGFPFADKVELYPDGQTAAHKIHPGLWKISRPLLETKIIEPAVKIYQTILKSNAGKFLEEPIPEYLLLNSISCSESYLLSKPFIIDDFSDYFDFLDNDEMISFDIRYGYPKGILMLNTAMIVFKHQNYEFQRALDSFEHLPEKQKQEMIDFYKSIIELNNEYIDSIKEKLRPPARGHKTLRR